jgi:hypothetical protein
MNQASSALALCRQTPDGKIYRKKWKACRYMAFQLVRNHGSPSRDRDKEHNGGRAVLDIYQEYSPEGIAACGNTYDARRSRKSLTGISRKGPCTGRYFA